LLSEPPRHIHAGGQLGLPLYESGWFRSNIEAAESLSSEAGLVVGRRLNRTDWYPFMRNAI
jgi:hypothetical protein